MSRFPNFIERDTSDAVVFIIMLMNNNGKGGFGNVRNVNRDIRELFDELLFLPGCHRLFAYVHSYYRHIASSFVLLSFAFLPYS